MICIQKKDKTIVLKENSNEIFELKSNSIIKSEFNNSFDFYANITTNKRKEYWNHL